MKTLFIAIPSYNKNNPSYKPVLKSVLLRAETIEDAKEKVINFFDMSLNWTVREAKIWCYDNGGKTFDSLTIINKENPFQGSVFGEKRFNMVGSSAIGVGFWLHDEIKSFQIGKHLGKRINFSSLNQNVQEMYIKEFNE